MPEDSATYIGTANNSGGSTGNTSTNTPGPLSGELFAPTEPTAPTASVVITNIPKFGTYSLGYPNDVVVLDLYNNNTPPDYLETNYRVSGSYQLNNTTITVDPGKDLPVLGYLSGQYQVVYKFHRNILGSGDGDKLTIHEISSDGSEVRVVPSTSNLPIPTLKNFFSNGFFQLPKAEVLPNLSLFKSTNDSVSVFDYVQDKFTFVNHPYSIIFKLGNPIPRTYEVGDSLWLAQEVSETLVDTVVINPPPMSSSLLSIAGPDFDIVSKSTTSTSTQYKNQTKLLTLVDVVKQPLLVELLSGSLLEGIPLNIEYNDFNNFIFFGSATERLKNFQQKVKSLENYSTRINELTTDLVGLPSSSATGSVYFQNNLVSVVNKQTQLLGSFDGYEKYLYYQTGSYITSSYGEFYPSTWPKYTTTKPYLNYSITSSQVQEWYTGIIASASLYDQNNQTSLYRLTPAHVLEDPANEEYILFVNMIGHYFDLVYAYIKQMTLKSDRQEALMDGFSQELIYHVAQSLGLDFESGTSLEELWSYVLGVDELGNTITTQEESIQEKTKQIWKRIINNLPYLLKTRGTERGLRALINCFGIPQTILRIREYGGAEPTFESKTDSVYERFFYSTTVGYNGKTSGQVAQLVEAPWKPLAVTNTMPSTVELRVKMAKNQTKTQTIFEVPNKWQVKAFQSASNNYIGFFLSGSQGYATASVSSSIYENVFHHIALERSVASDNSSTNQTYTLIVKRVNYLKVTSTVSASLYIDGTTSSSYNTSYTSTGSLWIPGSGSFLAATSHSMNILSGSVQELKYWTTPLQDAILDNHALAPTSFQGNLADTHTGSTSSFYDLGFRLCLGTDNKKINLATTSSINSQHPDQTKTGLSGSFYNFSGSYFNPVVEIHSLEWPDLGGNRSVSNKIRIENIITTGRNQLFRNTSVQKNLSDSNPPESPRLGVYLSPTNEINQDIAEQFGGLSIDDFIGNPANKHLNEYPELEALRREYQKKYTATFKTQNYIRLLQHYDASLFKLIKKFVPYRANIQAGLLIEPTLLHRNKVPTPPLTRESLHYSSSINVGPEALFTVGGFVEDGGGDFRRGLSGYVLEGTIGGDEYDYIAISSDQQKVSEHNKRITYPDRVYEAPNQGIQMVRNLFSPTKYDMVVIGGNSLGGNTMVNLTGQQNQFNSTGIDDNPSQPNTLTATMDLGISSYGRDTRAQGSKYVFMTHMTSQSAFVSYYGASTYDTTFVYSAQDLSRSQLYLVTASRYDYHDPINPVIMDSSISSIANVGNVYYNTNIFYSRSLMDTSLYGYVSASGKTIYTSSAALYENNWTGKYGLKIETLKRNNVLQSTPFTGSAFWGITGSLGLFFETTTYSTTYTGSAKLPAFYYKKDEPKTHDHLYTITVVVGTNQSYGTTSVLELHFGDLDCILTGSMVPTYGVTTYTFTTPVTGPWLGLRLYTTGGNPAYYAIQSLKVQPLNYRSQTQDYHLQSSRGMLNARYNGCKLTSPDWNINSNTISSTHIGNLPIPVYLTKFTASVHTTDNRETIDKGPVVSITVGGGQQLRVKPGARGNFKVTKNSISTGPQDTLGWFKNIYT